MKESSIEDVVLDWLNGLGCTVLSGPGIVKAKLRVMVKRILRKYGYPPDKQERATQAVLQQAELLAPEWVAA